jgi:polysaccharide export outer membrane protein
MNRIVAVVLAVALAGLGACSTPRYSADLLRTPIDAPYQLASGDRLRVIVFGQDNLSNSFSVDGAGNVAMPLIGLVHAQGLTTSQLAKVVEGKLRQGFLRDPSVSVEVEAYRPFFVLGEVTVAGQYPFVNGMTVQNAVAVAGGFTPRGFQGSVDLTRMIDGRPVTASVPLTFAVRPGDTIQARERFF